MSNSPLAGLCQDCREEANKWLDYRKPLVGGITLTTNGSLNHTVPTRTRTMDILKSQLKLIQASCIKNHSS